jgi:hypothetical protein
VSGYGEGVLSLRIAVIEAQSLRQEPPMSSAMELNDTPASDLPLRTENQLSTW